MMSQTDVSQQEPLLENVVQTDSLEQQPDARVTVETMSQEIPREPNRSSSRDRKHTEKGMQYEIDLHARHYKSAISAWRRQMNDTTISLSDVTDINRIRHARNQVVGNMNEVNDIFDCLSSLPLDETQKLYFSNLFETVESEHNRFLSKLQMEFVTFRQK